MTRLTNGLTMRTNEKFLMRQREPEITADWNVGYINFSGQPHSVSLTFRETSYNGKHFKAVMSPEEADRLADDLRTYAAKTRIYRAGGQT